MTDTNNTQAHTAEEMAQGAADALDPMKFEPFIKKATDDIYDQLLVSVQDYLIENSSFNIQSTIDALQADNRAMRPAYHALQGLNPDAIADVVAALRELVLTADIQAKIWSKDTGSHAKRERDVAQLDNHKKRAMKMARAALAKLKAQS